MALTLIDAVASWHLQKAGLPTITGLASNAGTPATDAYLALPSEVQSFSGYGQLLSALSDFSGALSGSNAALNFKQITSSDESVAVISAGASAPTSTGYSVAISQIAQGTVLKSSYRASDATTPVLTNGTFSIQLGTYDRRTRSFDAASDATTITPASSSLNDIKSAINTANAGVTADVGHDANGYYLTIASNSTGAANYISVEAPPDSLFSTSVTTLGLQETQVAQDASYTVGGIAGTSATNQATIATDTTLVLKKPGNATIAVTSTLGQSVTDVSGVTNAAKNIVNSYNALMSRINTLNSGQLASNADLATIATALKTASTNTYGVSSVNDLTDIGITSTTPDTLGNFLTLDTTSNPTPLATAFSSNPTGTVTLLSNVQSAFPSIISGYSDPSQSILSGLKTTLFSGYDVSGTPTWVQNAVLAYELNSSL